MQPPEAILKLVACPVCHTQYDVSAVDAPELVCRCGEKLANRPPSAVDAVVARCASCGAQVGAEASDCSYCGAAIVRDPDKLSLICPECFARNAEASRFCTACGVAFAPEPIPMEGRELPCPACETRMPPSQVAGIAVNECPGCHGLWVAGDHFDALVQRAVRTREQRSPGDAPPRTTGGNPVRQELRYRRCPECDQFMLRTNYRRSSGIILDECRSHGTWLDADELEQVAGFILSGARTSPMLDAEHERAKQQAGLAYVRARVENPTARPMHGLELGGGGLLRLLRDILDTVT